MGVFHSFSIVQMLLNRATHHILLQDIKNDVNESIQNEIKQKLNLHNKEEYQALVDKMIITTLEKETEFFKTEVIS